MSKVKGANFEQFKIQVDSKLEHQDEHIKELQGRLEVQMTQGFKEILTKFSKSEPEYDFLKTIKTIGATIAISGSIVSGLIWLVNSQVAVPNNELLRIQKDFNEFKKEYSVQVMEFHRWKVNVTTMKKDLDGNSAFIDNYMFVDKVPVRNSERDSRVKRLEEITNEFLKNIHNKKGD